MIDWAQKGHDIVDGFMAATKAAEAKYVADIDQLQKDMIAAGVSQPMQDAVGHELLSYLQKVSGVS
jgi:UDP-N-acetyl-D-mannosaminuronic acid transferase (WecB/TagA/CpsF family)